MKTKLLVTKDEIFNNPMWHQKSGGRTWNVIRENGSIVMTGFKTKKVAQKWIEKFGKDFLDKLNKLTK